MASIKVDGKSFELDNDGHLVDWEEWNENVATHFSKKDKIELTEEHWEIIKFLRNYFQKYQILPLPKMLLKEVCKFLGEKKGNTRHIYNLYPDGMKQASRYAGLSKPMGTI